ncbi:MAG: PIN domain-containing protein [Myxococcales bacterium]|nr:PIN domain-containing protein [Myxococcales bacterium]
MNDRAFLDTNILIYAADADAGDKQARAQAILRDAIATRMGVLSTQILQEYFVVATRKLGVSPVDARRNVELLATLEVVAVDVERILGAIDLHRLHSLSFWDALVVRCASAAGCTRLLSEDLQAGQVIDSVRVENPFA